MYYLAVSLYELGQFLRIVLWITLPLFIIATLLTTWLHYKRRRSEARLVLSIEGGGFIEGEGKIQEENERVSETRERDVPETLDEGMENENMYKGLLWLKEKYEQYREQTDRKYEKLREEFELLRTQTPPTPASAAENAVLRNLLEEKNQLIQSLQQQLDEMVAKLQNNSQQLLNIYHELDKSFNRLQSPIVSQTGLGQ